MGLARASSEGTQQNSQHEPPKGQGDPALGTGAVPSAPLMASWPPLSPLSWQECLSSAGPDAVPVTSAWEPPTQPLLGPPLMPQNPQAAHPVRLPLKLPLVWPQSHVWCCRTVLVPRPSLAHCVHGWPQPSTGARHALDASEAGGHALSRSDSALPPVPVPGPVRKLELQTS